MGNPSLTLDPAFLVKTVMGKGGMIKPQLDLQGIVTWNSLFALAAVVAAATPVPEASALFCAVARTTRGTEFVGAGRY